MSEDPTPANRPIELSAIQARVLGCLMEKRETTPDQYPLTLNSLRNACNQKSARDPVTDYSEGEVGHAVRELEDMGLVREEWGARAPKYKHCAEKILGLHSRGIALLCVLMLRGPQTAGELKNHCQRLFAFDDLDDVVFALGNLEKHEPPLVTTLPRQTGQKEARVAHLMCGAPDVQAARATTSRADTPASSPPGLEARVSELEASLELVLQRLARLEHQDHD